MAAQSWRRCGLCLAVMCTFAVTGCQPAYIVIPADLSVFEAHAARARPTMLRFPIELSVAQLQDGLLLSPPAPPGTHRVAPIRATHDDEPPPPPRYAVFGDPGDAGHGRALGLVGVEGIAAVAVLTGEMVNGRFESAEPLLAEARKRNASLLLIYTLDGRSSRKSIPLIDLLDLLTCGVFPAAIGGGSVRARAMLIDAETGFIHGRYEARGSASQLANRYTLDEAEVQAFRRAQDRASVAVLDAFAMDWDSVVKWHLSGSVE